MGIPFDQIVIQTVNGIVTGMILALIASGLTLIFGIMDVVNFAHGELFMLGAYVGVLVLSTTGNFWLALIVATLAVALLGAALQIVILRPLLGRDPLMTILATFGISLVLQNYALWQFGPVARKIQEPFTGQFTLFAGAELRKTHPELQARAAKGGQAVSNPRDLMKPMVTRRCSGSPCPVSSSSRMETGMHSARSTDGGTCCGSGS
jgi:hypothetical protein